MIYKSRSKMRTFECEAEVLTTRVLGNVDVLVLQGYTIPGTR